MHLPKDHLSYNQIRQYQICPRKYKYSYIENVKAPINDKIFLGIVFHSTVEYFLKARLQKEDLDPELVLEFYQENFKTSQEENTVLWDIPKDKVRQKGYRLCRHFLSDISTELDPLMVEEEMEVTLTDLGIKLKGIPDLIEKDFSITDFKTTTAKWSKNRINQSFLQMVIYKYIFEQCYGSVIKELKFRILYARNESVVKNQVLTLKSQDVDFDRMFDIIYYVADSISKGRFYKNEGFHCRFCEYKPVCLTPG